MWNLRRNLFEKGRNNDYIPEETYQAVAEILKWLDQLESAEKVETEANIELFK